MYLFFTLFGILFCCVSTFIIYFIYDLFPINKITDILNPTEKSIWNDINIAVLPTLVWGLIEMPVFGFNNLFIISIILNICVGSAVMYIIKYSSYLFNNKNTLFYDLISIFIAVLFGQIIEGFVIAMGNSNINIFISILSLIGLIVFVLYLKINPPKTFFFTEKK